MRDNAIKTNDGLRNPEKTLPSPHQFTLSLLMIRSWGLDRTFFFLFSSTQPRSPQLKVFVLVCTKSPRELERTRVDAYNPCNLSLGIEWIFFFFLFEGLCAIFSLYLFIFNYVYTEAWIIQVGVYHLHSILQSEISIFARIAREPACFEVVSHSVTRFIQC